MTKPKAIKTPRVINGSHYERIVKANKANAATGPLPARQPPEWKPYIPSKAMIEATQKAREYHDK